MAVRTAWTTSSPRPRPTAARTRRSFIWTNLLLHAANGVLVYFLSLRLLSAAGFRCQVSSAPLFDYGQHAAFNAPWNPRYAAAALGAALWALHPLRVESAAWVTERRDVLSGFFLLSALIAYLRAFPARTTALLSPRCTSCPSRS